MASPRILVLPPPELYHRLIDETADRRLRGLGQVEFNREPRDLTSEELQKRIAGVDVLFTGWRSPKLTDGVLAAADGSLKLVAHSAGSVRFMLDETLLARGVRVTSVAAAMAQPVAEMSVLLAMLMLRPVFKLDAAMRAGASWPEMKAAGLGEEFCSQPVGVVGAGHVGRRVIQLLKAWDVGVWVYDPLLPPAAAESMGVRRAESINELMTRSRIVTLHAPVLPETKHMIGREQLALLRDGGVLINTARAWLVDNDALLAELRAGRIKAALDVYDVEPVPNDSPWRSAPNALLLPHLGALTRECLLRQGEYAVDEIERFLAGKPLQYEITPASFATMA